MAGMWDECGMGSSDSDGLAFLPRQIREQYLAREARISSAVFDPDVGPGIARSRS